MHSAKSIRIPRKGTACICLLFSSLCASFPAYTLPSSSPNSSDQRPIEREASITERASQPSNAGESEHSETSKLQPKSRAKQNLTINLSTATDQQLTLLASRWGQLNPAQRRSLLAEMRGRMSRSPQSRSRLLGATNKRQYGVIERRVTQAASADGKGRVFKEVRRVRQPDGRVMVETRIVQVTKNPQTPSTQQTHQGQPAAQIQHDAAEVATPRQRSARVTFGIGFEQRKRREANSEDLAKPMLPNPDDSVAADPH